jgi:hypothetical protein
MTVALCLGKIGEVVYISSLLPLVTGYGIVRSKEEARKNGITQPGV